MGIHRPQDKYSVAALVCAAGRGEQCGKCLDRTSWRGGEWRSIGVNVGSIGDVFGGIGLGRVRVERGVGFWVSGDWFFGLGMVVWFGNGCLVWEWLFGLRRVVWFGNGCLVREWLFGS